MLFVISLFVIFPTDCIEDEQERDKYSEKNREQWFTVKKANKGKKCSYDSKYPKRNKLSYWYVIYIFHIIFILNTKLR